MWIQWPILALISLMFLLFCVTLGSRVYAVKRQIISVGDMFSLNTETFPKTVRLLGNNFDNQFQIPVLFIAALIFAEMDAIDGLTWQIAAWVFVLSRYWHTFEHVIAKNLLRRALSFSLGALTFFGFWLSLIIHYCVT